MPGLSIAAAVVAAVVIFLVVVATHVVDVQEQRNAACATSDRAACDDARGDATRATALALAGSGAAGVVVYIVTRRAIDADRRSRRSASTPT